MDNNKKVLLAQIKKLLKGPQPERSIVYFEGYHLSETLKGTQTTKIITQDRAKAILNEDPECQAHFIYLTHQDPPANLTDDFEKFEWLRANQIDPVIPEEIKERINPPAGVIIGVCDRKVGKSLIELFTTGVV